jgi:pimeloyl-ACP methyl ester carboxylesterase
LCGIGLLGVRLVTPSAATAPVGCCPPLKATMTAPFKMMAWGMEDQDLAAVLDATGARNVFGTADGALFALHAAISRPDIERVAAYEPRVTAIAITTCGRSARWSSECPNARAPASAGLVTSSSAGSSASSASSSAVSVSQ